MLARFLVLLTLLPNSVFGITTEGRVINSQKDVGRLAKRDDVDPALLYPAHNLSVPIDHYHNSSRYEPHSDGKFNLRYWYDDTYYKAGGPVIMLCGGETGGDDRLPYLQKGIVYELAKATGGLGVILEHRYYGTSFPTSDLSTENLRFLTTEQALADTAYFAEHVKVPGIDVSPENTPWIAYGGSYAGGFVAFLRKLYPEVFYGAIGSSAVVEAIYDYWQYYNPIAEYGPKECIKTTQTFVSMFDKILIESPEKADLLKTAFGLGNLTSAQDFVYTLTYPLQEWQSRNWDPAVNDPNFMLYCGNISDDKALYNPSAKLSAMVDEIFKAAYDDHSGYGGGHEWSHYPQEGHGSSHKGYEHAEKKLKNRMLNFIGFMKTTYVDGCTESQDYCFSQLNATYFAQHELSTWTWRCWDYQYCDEWGYLQTGSGVPRNQKPIISRLIDLEYSSFVCKAAFGINRPSNVTSINKYGGFDISYPRLAFIGGQIDPWKDATILAEWLPRRKSTPSEPVIEIAGAVHHCKLAPLTSGFWLTLCLKGMRMACSPMRPLPHCLPSRS